MNITVNVSDAGMDFHVNLAHPGGRVQYRELPKIGFRQRLRAEAPHGEQLANSRTARSASSPPRWLLPRWT